MMAYKACKQLIEAGKTTGLSAKIDLFFAYDRLTLADYMELMALLVPDCAENPV